MYYTDTGLICHKHCSCVVILSTSGSVFGCHGRQAEFQSRTCRLRKNILGKASSQESTARRFYLCIGLSFISHHPSTSTFIAIYDKCS